MGRVEAAEAAPACGFGNQHLADACIHPSLLGAAGWHKCRRWAHPDEPARLRLPPSRRRRAAAEWQRRGQRGPCHRCCSGAGCDCSKPSASGTQPCGVRAASTTATAKHCCTAAWHVRGHHGEGGTHTSHSCGRHRARGWSCRCSRRPPTAPASASRRARGSGDARSATGGAAGSRISSPSRCAAAA